MPFPVSVSFSSSSFPFSTTDMLPSSSQQKQKQGPPLPPRVKRARPLGLLKARRTAPSNTPLGALGEQRRFAAVGSDHDSYLDGTVHANPLVTKQHQQEHHPPANLSAIPQSIFPFTNTDFDNPAYCFASMISSSSTGPTDRPSTPNFGYQDWLDLKHLFSNVCAQYLESRGHETIKALRGVLNECHRFLLSFDDPSILFAAQPRPSNVKNQHQQQSRFPQGTEAFIQKMRENPSVPADLPTAFYTLFGTTLLFFGNCMSSHPEHAEPGEPPSGIPFWIAALDIFETGENSPSRFSGNTFTSTYGGSVFWDRVGSPREDWLMAIMWGRTLVALADAMLERNKTNPPPPPKPQHFPSPFPVNTDYLKTGTIWDEEPEWPKESPLGVIVNRRPPISRRMALADATPNDILQLARDHIARGMFHMPRHGASPFLPPDSEHPAAPLFTRTRILYDTGYPIILAAEQLNDYDERKEWFSYAESIFAQIRLANPRRAPQVSERASLFPSSGTGPDVPRIPESISDGEIETVHGRAWVLIGSSIAEDLEGTMEDDNDDETAPISPIRQQKAAEAKNALHRGIDLVQNAILRIKNEPLPAEREEDVETAYEYDILSGDDLMLIQEVDHGDDSSDDKRMRESDMSARARGKQPAESDMEALRNARNENRRISVIAARLRREQEADIEKAERIRLLEEGYISLANVACLTKNKEEEDKYLRLAEIIKGERTDEDEDMEEDD